jgi:hypothetical protein
MYNVPQTTSRSYFTDPRAKAYSYAQPTAIKGISFKISISLILFYR